MLQLKDIQARLPRLRQRVEGFAQEIDLWRTAENPLLYWERHHYLQSLHEAIAGLAAAAMVLEGAAQRIEALDLPTYLGGGREEGSLQG